MLDQIAAILNRLHLACHPDPDVPPDAWRAWLSAFVEPSGPQRQECPQCGCELRARRGKRGRFLGCSSYPECRYTTSAPPETPPVPKSDLCPLCRRGRFVNKVSQRGKQYRQCGACGEFEGARFLTAAERVQAKADRARKTAAKKAAKEAEKRERDRQRAFVIQLPSDGFDFREWGEAWI